MAFGLDELEPRRHDRRRRQRLRRRGQAPAVRPRRHRPARRARPRSSSSPTPPPTPSSSPPTCSARPSTAPPRRRCWSRTSRELGRGGARARSSAAARLADSARSPAPPGATTARSSCARDRAEAIELANDYAHEHLEVHAADDELDCLPRRPAQLRLAVPRRAGDGRLRRQGGRHQPRAARPRGAARYTGGLWVGKFLKTLTYQRLTEEGTRTVAPAAAAISDAEAFAGHALTARMRLERLGRRSPVTGARAAATGASSRGRPRHRPRLRARAGAGRRRGRAVSRSPDELERWPRDRALGAPPGRSRST